MIPSGIAIENPAVDLHDPANAAIFIAILVTPVSSLYLSWRFVPVITRAQEPYSIFEQVQRDGAHRTPLEGVSVFRISEAQQKSPMLYEVGVTFVLSGRKAGVFNNARFEYGPDQGLLVATPYPIACEAFCSPQAPLRGIHIRLDLAQLRTLLDEMDALPAQATAKADDLGVSTFPMTPQIRSALDRLAAILGEPSHCHMLGASLLREIFYWILHTQAGSNLRAFATRDTTSNRLMKAVEHINHHYAERIQIEDLAHLSGMSVSAFHRAFKKTVSDAPLQYIKKVRLTKAKALIVRHGESAGQAGLKVGYDSAAQFSREFKRFFGVSPRDASQLSYQDFE
ncbi:hypothetical protein A3843_13925 [Pseudovibrio exalbescens]|uniref:HTH araC/xylS-type domain-containing protein n=1 Tax=Pseudovibrio exalbescens TaxID=197461 RepID=A0A1U7JF99_9HYPH|nr:hypothetical protein A3843_13925 [Pseudovibrio exalbescens]